MHRKKRSKPRGPRKAKFRRGSAKPGTIKPTKSSVKKSDMPFL